MQLEVTKESIDKLKLAIEDGNDRFVEDFFHDAHPVDVCEFIYKLSAKEAQYLLKLLDEELVAEVLVELDEDAREQLMASLTSREIAEIIDNVDSDDAADVLSELSDSKKEEVISMLEDAEQASDIIDLLTYDEGTAGSLMAKELIKVNVNWPVTQAIREMRKQADEVGEVFTIYVVDDLDRLVGTLSLKRLLFSTSIRSTIADIYNSAEDKKMRYVKANQKAEDVVELMNKYDLVVLPVIDDNQILVGRITIDDVVDVMQEESERDYQMAAGLSQAVESDDKVWILSRARLPWLLIGLVGGILSAKVIGIYEHELQINPKLAFFMPLIAAMGGNSGVQSSAIVVQGLANGLVSLDGLVPRLFKEFLVALINATVCGALILAYNYLTESSWELGLTVGISLISVIIFASLFGTFIPLLLDRFKIDPALATGPFITTTNDILGLTIYFSVGHVMYGF